MDRAPIQSIVTEAEAAATVLADPIEGESDFLRLNIHDDTRSIVQGRLDGLMRRRDLIKVVWRDARQLIADIEALEADGYPIVPIEEVSASVFQDLDEQRRTIAAAFALMSPPSPTTGVDGKVSDERPTP